MVIFNQGELNYIQKTFFKTSNDVRHINKTNGEYQEYLINVARKQTKDMKYVLKNFDKINIDEKINKITSNTMYCLSGMDNLSEDDKEKELKNRIKHKGKLILYMKILNDVI